MNDFISQIVVRRTTLVEVSLADGGPINAGNTYKWKFNDFLSKGNILVYGIELVTAAELAVSPSQRPIIAAVDAANVTIDLVTVMNSKAVLQNYPAQRLRPSQYNGYTQYIEPQLIDTQMTLCRLMAAGTLATTQSICFTVYYKFKDE